MARKERELGRRSLLDLLNGEVALINAQSDAAAARVDEVIAAYREDIDRLMREEAQRIAEGIEVVAVDLSPTLVALARERAPRGLAITAGVGGARQHAVFGRHPALATALLVARHLLFDRGGAQHLGVAKLDQHRALGVHGVVARDAHWAQLGGGSLLAALIRGWVGRHVENPLE